MPIKRNDKSKKIMDGIVEDGPGRYLVRVDWTDPRTGQRKKRRAVASSLAEAVGIKEDRSVASPKVARTRLADFSEQWCKDNAVRWEPSTRDRYARALGHIAAGLGDHWVDSITPADVRRWQGQVSKGLAASTVNGWLRVLRCVLEAAVTDEILARNPARSVKALPEDVDPEDPNALTEVELRALLESFRKNEPEHYPVILTLAITGLRWGEASALKWSDLDREAGIIRVRRAHWLGQVKATKTKRPRTAPLPALLKEELDLWHAQLMKAQHVGLAEGWCFPSDTGKPRTGGVMTKPMKRCLELAGIDKRVSVQGLRRSAEDVLRRLGVAGPVAEALLGHNAQMRSRYSTVSLAEVANIGGRIVDAIGHRSEVRHPAAPPEDSEALAGGLSR